MEKINFEEQEKSKDNFDLSEFSSKFVKMPKVGEETGWILIEKFKPNYDTARVTKTGRKFDIGLGDLGFAPEIHSGKGTLTVNNWETYGKIKTGLLKLAKELNKENLADLFKERVELFISHDFDGQDKEGADNLKAQSEKKLYTVKLKVSNGEARTIQNGEWV